MLTILFGDCWRGEGICLWALVVDPKGQFLILAVIAQLSVSLARAKSSLYLRAWILGPAFTDY